MNDPNTEIDLSFLEKHDITTLSFCETHFVIHSYGVNYNVYENPDDMARITVSADFEWNGKSNDRSGLLTVLGKSIENVSIDENLSLRVVFAGGDVVRVPRVETAHESYRIESNLFPDKIVAQV
jgi:hypothetical protein